MVKYKTLLIGSTGFLGSQILKLAPKNIILKKAESNLLNFNSVREELNKTKPQIIIHAARVNPFDDNPIKVKKATQALVRAVKSVDAKLVYISSDAVFDGTKGSYKENDEPNPISDYGKAKLMAENVIKNNLKNFIIIRPSYIYGQNRNRWDKRTQTLIDNIKNKKIVYRFKDMHRSPILAANLARAIWRLINRDFSGVIHIAGKRKNIFKFSREIIEALGFDTKFIKPNLLKNQGLNFAPDTSLNTDLAKKIINFRPK